MLTLITLLLSLFTSPSSQAHPPLPPSCEAAECSDPMRAIEAEFAEGHAPAADREAGVASGACYHRAPTYYAEQAHYGFALLDRRGGNAFLSALFGFFYSENPYSAVGITEARVRLPERFSPERALRFLPEFAFADMRPGDEGFPWRYWLKENKGALLLLADWGPEHQIFCRFLPNQP